MQTPTKVKPPPVHLRAGLRAAGVVSAVLCTASGSAELKAAEYVAPAQSPVAPEAASREILRQSAAESNLRVAGLDLFPHASVTGMYDDNVTISAENAISDFEWSLMPGLTVTYGEFGAYPPETTTIRELRGALAYTFVDENVRPERFLALDYTPSFNLFTEHGRFDNVDHLAQLATGYRFAKLELTLDQDYSRRDVKESQVGTRITVSTYDTFVRARYNLNDRSALEINGSYYVYDYEDQAFQGYKEFRNEDWFNRRLGGKLSVGLGAAFGFVFPQVNHDQTYQQLLGRAEYRISEKLQVHSEAGVELREYGGDQSDTVDPVFSIFGDYRLRETTSLFLEAHRRDEPSPYGSYNYITLGFSAGVRQLLFGRLYANLSAGYDNVDYTRVTHTTAPDRSDSYYSARASLDYEFNPHWTASVYYIRRQDDSSLDSYTYENNMAGFQVSWRY